MPRRRHTDLFFEDEATHPNRSENLTDFLDKANRLRQTGNADAVWTLIDDLGRQTSLTRHRVDGMDQGVRLFFFGDNELGFPSKLEQLRTTVESSMEKAVEKITEATTHRIAPIERSVARLTWEMALIGAVLALILAGLAAGFFSGYFQHVFTR